MYKINSFNKEYLALCDEFAKRFMGDDYNEEDDNIRDYYRLVGSLSDFGLPGPMDIGDEMYSLEDIWGTINHNIPIDIVRKYNEYDLECYYDKTKDRLNLYRFWKKSLSNNK